MHRIFDKGKQRIDDDLDLVKIIRNLRDVKVVMNEFVKKDIVLKKIIHENEFNLLNINDSGSDSDSN